MLGHPLRAVALALPAVSDLVSGAVLGAREDKCLPAVQHDYSPTYYACFDDPQGSTFHSGVLNGSNTASITVTSQNSPEFCAALCGARGYTYAGVESGSQCFCHNVIQDNATKTDDEKCDVVCPGDPTQKCGGMNFIAVYNILPIPEDEVKVFPDCAREPLCSNAVCDTSLTNKERAAALVSELSIKEKLDLLVDKSPGVPRLGIKPYFWWTEGLHGLAESPGADFEDDPSRKWSSATSFPSPILVGAAFDDALARKMTFLTSKETRAYNNAGRSGLDLWSPNINTFKDPRWGRGQETPGEDPFHAQSYVSAIIAGFEDDSTGYKNTIATCKHYAANDFDNTTDANRYNFDAKISLQDLSEYYLPPFKTCAVQKSVGSFMCSYNGVNGAPACANRYLLQDILRDHWAWEKDEHYITTDCGVIDYMVTEHKYTDNVANASALAMAAGTDLQCNLEHNNGLWGAWNQSLITEEDVDRATTRLYSALVSVGLFDPADQQPLRDLGWDDVNTEEARDVAYQLAIEGPVLLKNDGTLPLKLGGGGETVAVVGPWYNATQELTGNYNGPAPKYISPLQGAKDLGLDVRSGLGCGIETTSDAAFEEGIEAARAADSIIFLGGIDNSVEAESHDREDLEWPEVQKSFVRELARLGKPLTVVQFGGGQLDGRELLSDDAVNGLLWVGYPGQSGGRAIMDLVYGRAAPAGRLPVTQYPASYNEAVPPTDMALRPGLGNSNQGRTYMWYTGEATVPFGFGLHYTSFEARVEGDEATWLLEEDGAVSTSSIASKAGSDDDGDLTWQAVLERPVVRVPVSVRNTGDAVTSDYVALVFMRSDAGPTPRPLKTLVGYARVRAVGPGETRSADVVVTVERLVRVDEAGDRVLYPGRYEFFVDIDGEVGYEFELEGDEVVVEKFPQPGA